MTDLILHHYPISPFAEKIRAILGYKSLAWHSVRIPVVMPKPDLMPLTGGYRKTPVLQIGSDVYCDTKLIARVLDRIRPEPPLLPPGRAATGTMLEQWSEKLFMLCVPLAMQPKGLAHLFGDSPKDVIEYFQKDRAALFGAGTGPKASGALTRSELPGYLAQLETQLGVAPYIDGAAVTLGDFSLYHPIWFVLSNPGVAGYFEPYPNIRAWAQRIAGFGHGKATAMTALQALAASCDAAVPEDIGNTVVADGLAAGAAVTVTATDYGGDAVHGELLKADADEIVIRRSDERAGTVRVHFPRTGFRLQAA